MALLKTGSTYSVASNDVSVIDRLPRGTYIVKQTQNGLVLEPTAAYGTTMPRERIAGDAMTRVRRVHESYDHSNTSIGCILSGVAGVGKTMIARLISSEFDEAGIPTILVTTGELKELSTFLLALDFPALVVFDEFEKMFDEYADTTQENLLTYFDDTNPDAKHLNLVLVNDPTKIIPQMRSRPGRFRYLMQISEPDFDAIRAYAKSRGIEEIADDLCALSVRQPVTYDVLEQIARERETFPDMPFGELVRDLNVVSGVSVQYRIAIDGVVYESGKKFSVTDTAYLDDNKTTARVYKCNVGGDGSHAAIDISFASSAIRADGSVDVSDVYNDEESTEITAVHVKRIPDNVLGRPLECF